ncbi:MAG: ERF family protein [Planctomycetota bacterium]
MAAPLSRPLTPTESLVQKAIEQGLDPGQLYGILATERADARKQEYSRAVADFQRQVTPCVKSTNRVVDRGGNTIDYASLADIRRHVDPLLHELGLTLSYGTEDVNGETYATVKLTHEGGHTEEARLPFKAAKPPGASNDAQAIGAGQTYAMRYLTTAILGLWFVDRDTDAVPGATVIDGPTISEEKGRDILDAILAAAERTGHNSVTIRDRVLKAHGVERVADLPANTVAGILLRLEGMK